MHLRRSMLLFRDVFIFLLGMLFSFVAFNVPDRSETNSGSEHRNYRLTTFDSAHISTREKHASYVDLENSDTENASVADALATYVRVLCLVLTTKKYHKTRAIYVKETWGRRCDKLIFASDSRDESLGAYDVQEQKKWKYLWGKTQYLFNLAHKKYLNDFDWFLKADDDSYVVMENLRLVLSEFSPHEPIMLSRQHNDFLQGAGYVLSRKAVNKLVTEAFSNETICNTKNIAIPEDREITRCLINVGAMVADSRDTRLRQRFFMGTPEREINRDKEDPNEFYPFAVNNPGHVSVFTASFHHVDNGKAMRTIDFLLYNVRIFGLSIICNATVSQVKQVLAKNGYNLTLPIASANFTHVIRYPEPSQHPMLSNLSVAWQKFYDNRKSIS